jgi:peptidyl-prolyl cis-trans isomerase B (cyclophilin B)
MTDNELTRLLRESVAEPPRALSPDTVLQRAKRRRHTRFAATGSALSVGAAAVAVVAVAVVPSLVPRAGGSVVTDNGRSPTADENPQGCTASSGGFCLPFDPPSPTPKPTTAAGTTCSYRPTVQDDPTPRLRQKAVGRDVGLPPATTGELPATATIHTNRGDITLALRPEAVCTVNSFTHLVRHAYFNGTPCFRLTTKAIYVLQCGDPSGTGSGGPGYVYDDENLDTATYPAGTIAMANSGPASNGSQFFIVYKDTELDPHYTVFGRVTAGLDVLTKIAARGSTPSRDGHPNLPVEIQSVSQE